MRVIFLKIGEIDTVKENFAADVFIQTKWKEPALNGHIDVVSDAQRAYRCGKWSSTGI